MLTKSIAVAVLTCALTVAAIAGPLEEANSAIGRRDFATAARVVRPLAERGDSNAQYMLGMFYGNGVGVPQDRVKAYMWLSLAASQGRENAATIRDLTARLMTAKQIEEGRQLAAQWTAVSK